MNRDEAVQKQIDLIMDTFEFDRVRKIMEALHWEWGFGEEAHIPEEYELRQAARELLRSVAESRGCSETGGFLAQCYDERSFVWLQLHFGIGTCNDGESYDS